MKISEIQDLLRRAIDAAEKLDLDRQPDKNQPSACRTLLQVLTQAIDEFEHRYDIPAADDFDLPLNSEPHT